MIVAKRAAVLAGLIAASLACMTLLQLRHSYTQSHLFQFLQWNLFLAWVPFLCAAAAYTIEGAMSRRASLRWAVVPLLAAWLIFLPNAPYLTTDFIHLKQWDATPLWFDIFLLGSYATTGLALGLVSLCLVHAMVARAAGPAAGWFFALGSLGLAAAGTYLGRFDHRWNSWDLVSRPGAVLADLWPALLYPLDHLHAVVFTLVFAAFLAGSYLALLAFNQRSFGTPV